MFTLGDVAGILDDALDMGINIVDALHKLAEAGDKGQLSREECLLQLDLPRDSSKSDGNEVGKVAHVMADLQSYGNDDKNVIVNVEDGFEKDAPCNSASHDGFKNNGELQTLSYGRNVNAKNSSHNGTDIILQDRSATSFDGSEISPLKIYSSNLKLEDDKIDVIGDEFEPTADYYDSPLQNYKSKRWSNTFALNIENDDVRPLKGRKGAGKGSRQPLLDDYGSSDEGKSYHSSPEKDEGYLNDAERPATKRKRRNTYSIESTPQSEAKEKGLPIIDALDDLCAMADQFMNQKWARLRSSRGSSVYDGSKFDYCSSEDEISPIASSAIDKKILALDEETAKVCETLTGVANFNASQQSEEILFEDQLRNITNGSNIDEIVDQKIADIGSQAEIVLKSFQSLKNLVNLQETSPQLDCLEDRSDNNSTLKQIFENINDPRKNHSSSSNYNMSDTNFCESSKLEGSCPINKDLKAVKVDLDTDREEEIMVEVPEAYGRNDTFNEVYSGLEEKLPSDFKTVANVQYDYIESSWNSSKSNTKLVSDTIDVASCAEKRRPGTYVLDATVKGISDSVYEEPVFISVNENQFSVHESQDNVKETQEVTLDSTYHMNKSINNGSEGNGCDGGKGSESTRKGSKEDRPSTYILQKRSLPVSSEIGIDDTVTNSRHIYMMKETEDTSCEQNSKKINGQNRRPGTYVLDNAVVPHGGADSKNETKLHLDPQIVKRRDQKELAHNLCRSERRPGTYVLDNGEALIETENIRIWSEEVCKRDHTAPETFSSGLAFGVSCDESPNDVVMNIADDTSACVIESRELDERKSNYSDVNEEVDAMNVRYCKKASRPATYVLARPTISNESFEENENISVVKGQSADGFAGQNMKSGQEDSKLTSTREEHGKHVGNADITLWPVATGEIFIDNEVQYVSTEIMEETAVNSYDSYNYEDDLLGCRAENSSEAKLEGGERRDSIKSEIKQFHAPIVVPEKSKKKRSRPSTYKIDKALSNVTQHSYEAVNEANCTESRTNVEPTDILVQDADLSPLKCGDVEVTASVPFATAEFKTISNVVLQNIEQTSTEFPGGSFGALPEKLAKSEATTDQSSYDGSHFQLRESASPHEWSVLSETPIAVSSVSISEQLSMGGECSIDETAPNSALRNSSNATSHHPEHEYTSEKKEVDGSTTVFNNGVKVARESVKECIPKTSDGKSASRNYAAMDQSISDGTERYVEGANEIDAEGSEVVSGGCFGGVLKGSNGSFGGKAVEKSERVWSECFNFGVARPVEVEVGGVEETKRRDLAECISEDAILAARSSHIEPSIEEDFRDSGQSIGFESRQEDELDGTQQYGGKKSLTESGASHEEISTEQQCQVAIVSKEQFGEVKTRPMTECQYKQGRVEVAETDRFLDHKGGEQDKGSATSWSEDLTEKTKMNLEMNNNDFKTVEKDFPCDSDYSEMADECAVLSTSTRSDCCSNEGFYDGAAGLNMSKEPVITRVHDLKRRQVHASANVKAESPKQGDDTVSKAFDNGSLQVSVCQINNVSEVDQEYNRQKSNPDHRDVDGNEYVQNTDEWNLNSDSDYEFVGKSSQNLSGNAEGEASNLQQASAGDVNEDMKGSRIAVKLEIDFSDLYENGRHEDGRRSPYKEGATVDRNEQFEKRTNADGDAVIDDKDVGFSSRDASTEERNINLQLKIDAPSSPDDDLNGVQSQGITFDINLGDGKQRVISPPGNLKKRLSAKKRCKRKAIHRPGTYVLNSPIFSRDEYEDEDEFKKSFTRRSLGSTDGVDLRDEIKKAVAQGRLELNVDEGKNEYVSDRSCFDDDGIETTAPKQTGYPRFRNKSESYEAMREDCKRSPVAEHLDSENGRSDGRFLHREDVQSSLNFAEQVDNQREGSDEFVAKRSTRRANRPGTYVLDSATTEDGLGVKAETYDAMQPDRVWGKETDDGGVRRRSSKASPRPGTYVLQGSKSGGESDAKVDLSATQQDHSPKVSPRRNEPGSRGSKKVETSARFERFEKFRKSFESQKIGFFVDLKDDDVDFKAADPSAAKKRDNIVDESLREIGKDHHIPRKCADDREFIDSRFIGRETGSDTVNNEISTSANICVNGEIEDESRNKTALNYSLNQLEEEVIAIENHTEDSTIVKMIDGCIDQLVVCGKDVKMPGDEWRGTEISGQAKASSDDDLSNSSLVAADRSNEDDAVICRAHNRTLSTGREEKRKSRYNSWEVTHDTEKEVLGKITSLKERASVKDPIGDMKSEVMDLAVFERRGHFVDEEFKEEEVKASKKPVECKGGDSPSQPTWKQSEYFVVDYDALVVEGRMSDDEKQDRRERGKVVSRKSDYFVIGEGFNADDVRSRRRSGDVCQRSDPPHDEKKDCRVKVQRKNTFVLQFPDDSMKNEAEVSYLERQANLSVEENNSVRDPITDKYVEGSKVEITNIEGESYQPMEITAREFQALKPGELAEERTASSFERDSGCERSNRDETVVEDFDLYVSNGSRPASGISESQSTESTNEFRESGEAESRRSSGISSNEDLVLDDNDIDTVSSDAKTHSNICNRDKAELISHCSSTQKGSPYGRTIDRQLSDTILTSSDHFTAKSGVGIFHSLDESKRGPMRLMERQLSDNVEQARAAVRGNYDNLTNSNASASMPSLDNDLTVSPFKLSKTHGRQNFGHRPTSCDVARKPLLERLETLCTFMSKSLTKLNSMSEGESEILSKLDEEHGREDLFVRRKVDGARYMYGEHGGDGTGDRERERTKSGSESVLGSVGEKQSEYGDANLRDAKSRTPRGHTYIIQGQQCFESEFESVVENNVSDKENVAHCSLPSEVSSRGEGYSGRNAQSARQGHRKGTRRQGWLIEEEFRILSLVILFA